MVENSLTTLQKRQDAVLIGLLLGDLHLQKTSSNTGKCRLRLSHSMEQKDYTDWIHGLFKDWCQKTQPPKMVQTRAGYAEYQFYSEYRDELKYYHTLFYERQTVIPRESITKNQRDGPLEFERSVNSRDDKISTLKERDNSFDDPFVKRLPENLEQLLLDPVSLAIWYLDDGTKRTDCNAGRIATQGFTLEEQRRLKHCVRENFSINMVIDTWHKKNGVEMHGLSIPSRGGEFQRLCDLIRPFVEREVPTMSYKLMRPRND